MSAIREWADATSSAEQSVEDVTFFPDTYSRGFRSLVLLGSAGIGAAGAFAIAPGAADADIAWKCLGVAAFLGGLLSTWSPCGYSSVSLLRPVGHSPAAVVRWLPTFVTHALGYAAGAVILGGGLALLGQFLGLSGMTNAVLAVLAVVGLVYGAHQLDFLRVPYPQRRAQVPHDARQRFPMWVIGALYGLALGLNYLTYVQTPLLYVVTLAAAASGEVGAAIGLFAIFNLGRFLPLVVNALPVKDYVVQAWMARNQERAAMFDGAVLVALGAAFAVLVLS